MRWTRPIRGGIESLTPRLVAGAIGISRIIVGDRMHWHICNAIGKLISGRTYQAVVDIGPESVMRVNLDDPYWSRLVAAEYEYEPELGHVLRALKSIDFDVLDCGANYGYWSILLSGAKFGRRRVIAIEASDDTFAVLTDNCALNGNRFECVYAAVSDTTGRCVVINKRLGHSAAHITDAPRQPTDCTVTCIALNDLANRVGDRVLIKLDVEGQEVQALQGAATLLRRDVLLCFEDHGLDRESRVTDFVLRELAMRIFFVDAAGRARRVESAADASALKHHTASGYNFFACADGSAFLPILDALTS